MKKELNKRLAKLKKKYAHQFKTHPEYVDGWIAGYMWGWADAERHSQVVKK